MTTVGNTTAPVDQALLPASVRNGSAERKEQYQAALAFERVLVGQLTEQLSKGSSMGTDDDAPAAVKLMKESLPTTLADSLMTAGGLGLAQQLDLMWNPDAHKKTSLSDLPVAADAPNAANAPTGPGGGTRA